MASGAAVQAKVAKVLKKLNATSRTVRLRRVMVSGGNQTLGLGMTTAFIDTDPDVPPAVELVRAQDVAVSGGLYQLGDYKLTFSGVMLEASLKQSLILYGNEILQIVDMIPYSLDGIIVGWTVNARAIKASVDDISAPDSGFMPIDSLGGDEYTFHIPTVADAYPSGATFDKLAPGSWTMIIKAHQFSSGAGILECSARVQATGARAKVELVDLASPDTPVAEIVFTANETLGESKRSTSFALPTSTDRVFGIKVTTNSTTIGAAVWGARLLRVS